MIKSIFALLIVACLVFNYIYIPFLLIISLPPYVSAVVVGLILWLGVVIYREANH